MIISITLASIRKMHDILVGITYSYICKCIKYYTLLKIKFFINLLKKIYKFKKIKSSKLVKFVNRRKTVKKVYKFQQYYIKLQKYVQ